MKILGIETSCDETAAAVVNDQRQILSNVIHSQVETHQPYGGVVPEIGARNHLIYLQQVIDQALSEAATPLAEIDAIAVTAGPGLIGGVMVGVMMAKAIAAAWSKPIIAINHLEAHALTARLSDNVPFPFLLLLISGGHCQFLLVRDFGVYHLLGQTIDDAVGEAFDKVARSLELDYPGGPQIERLARQGDPKRFALPRPLKGRPGCDISLAGLKTAVRLVIEKDGFDKERDQADLAASFQTAIGDCLIDRLKNCLESLPHSVKHLVVAGGVAANQYLRQRLQAEAAAHNVELVAPPVALCTDNAAMIAWAGIEHFSRGHSSALTFIPRPRWPLTEL